MYILSCFTREVKTRRGHHMQGEGVEVNSCLWSIGTIGQLDGMGEGP